MTGRYVKKSRGKGFSISCSQLTKMIYCSLFCPSLIFHREELIEHYSKLSEEATRKEQKALWKIQRHKLETARLKFFWDDEKHIQVHNYLSCHLQECMILLACVFDCHFYLFFPQGVAKAESSDWVYRKHKYFTTSTGWWWYFSSMCTSIQPNVWGL